MAARWMQAKMMKLKPQTVEAARSELTKACYFTAKPEVPAYDVAMVRRVENKTKARKTVYREAPARTLVSTGLTREMFSSSGDRLIKRG